ncbi:hypothetical protein PY365_08025 [Roseiarcaceae bacterium H3SJ34-1]|uniref:hypothetical protein n=1 Tax=Terripilifer ovatus TaxID=3032367 RepID=UPI003AB9337D|nr:hypothetical protein [Roseiarcaceae bacterium H3SJ34-1]
MKRIALAIAAVVAADHAAAADYAFVGRWDCGVATFTFTPRTYNNGSQTMRFNKIEFGKGSDFKLTFPDGYSISLLDVKAKTMTWHSMASGDIFECTRK